MPEKDRGGGGLPDPDTLGRCVVDDKPWGCIGLGELERDDGRERARLGVEVPGPKLLESSAPCTGLEPCIDENWRSDCDCDCDIALLLRVRGGAPPVERRSGC